MFKKKDQPEAETAASTSKVVDIPINVEVYAMSKAADRIRLLEAELVSTFEEWAQAQGALADQSLIAEFKMSAPLQAAWSAWRAEKYRAQGGANGDDAPTSVIPVPDQWPS